MRDQTHRGGFSIGSGDRNDGNTAVLPIFKQHRHNGFAHGAAFAKGGAQVHPKSGRGIDFHHAAALLFNRAQDAVADHVDPANMQAHHMRSSHSAGGHIGVNVIGHVGGRTTGR